MKRAAVLLLAVGLLLSAGLSVAQAVPGKIVVNNDEWTLSEPGFGSAPDAGRFVVNVANWFTGGVPGNFLAYSTNFGLTGASVAAAMTAAGHSWTVDATGPFDLATLLQYDGVFVGLPPPVDNQVLIDYVNAGGNVYVMAGTGFGGPVFEAAAWNVFLNEFGLRYEPFYALLPCANYPVSSSHPVLDGVGSLFFCNGNPVSRLSPTDPHTEILLEVSGLGFIGVFDPVVSFAAFDAKVEFEGNEFEVKAPFTLGAGSNGIAPLTEDVTLELTGGTGSFATTIPAGSFKQDKKGRFKFEGSIGGVHLEVQIRPLGGNQYEFKAEGEPASLGGITNPVTVTLTIGDDAGTVSVTAEFE